ncbi:Diphosphomevalonate decarboxylase [Neofusicoccum parvum]|nr:Diphosphomevalonate decarboxylase [Neofusicoccum parvum]
MGDQRIYSAVATAPVNIATIKYWGKSDENLNLPTNSSLSVTLSQDDLRTRTTVSCSASYSGDTIVLNDQVGDASTPRLQKCLTNLRILRRQLEATDQTLPPLSRYGIHIVSENNFPTASGLASSASGFACLVRATADLYSLCATVSAAELSGIARLGSGSACRSLMGGYVAWDLGNERDGSDSRARQVAAAAHWPDMRALILVVRDRKKDVSSSSGMQLTVRTSELAAYRAERLVPVRMRQMEAAVMGRDFEAFGRLTMMESNSFHALCLDTHPPIMYMDDSSRAAIRIVEHLNARAEKIVAAYSFDAGPNPVIFYLEEHQARVAGSFKTLLPGKQGWDSGRGKEIHTNDTFALASQDADVAVLNASVSRVILTAVGDGPRSIESTVC